MKPSEINVENLEQGDIASLLELDTATLDPGMHYRWVRAVAKNVGNAKIKGYTVVPSDGEVKTRAGYLDDTSDGTMRIQDVILMACPLDRWRTRKRAALKKGNARLTAPKKQFKKSARRHRTRMITNEDED